jgi:hypothetical protein
VLAPMVPHINTLIVLGALVVIDACFLALGLSKFDKKAVS